MAGLPAQAVIPRRIAVVTGGRFDFTRYKPILAALEADPDVELRLMATGGHFASAFGRTIAEVEALGYGYEPGLEMMLASDTPASIGKAVGLGTISFAQAFAMERPDMVVILGDRFEMLCAPIAAMGFKIPVVHIHGGAVTEGAIDELVRHALTKMSHLHLVSLEEYRRRVIQMGEEEWRVTTVGAPVLDEIVRAPTLSRTQLAERLGLDFTKPVALFCYHPVTLEVEDAASQVEGVLDALGATGLQVVATYPNPDLGSTEIIERVETFAAARPERVRVVRNAGSELFLSLLKVVDVMLGNSSAGIVEAASFALPVVNVGTRQDGKLHPPNVINVGYGFQACAEGLTRALDPTFRAGLADLVNPYGDGNAAQRIVKVLKETPINDRLLRKKFVDLSFPLV